MAESVNSRVLPVRNATQFEMGCIEDNVQHHLLQLHPITLDTAGKPLRKLKSTRPTRYVCGPPPHG